LANKFDIEVGGGSSFFTGILIVGFLEIMLDFGDFGANVDLKLEAL
jgi:hypothetical protein